MSVQNKTLIKSGNWKLFAVKNLNQQGKTISVHFNVVDLYGRGGIVEPKFINNKIEIVQVPTNLKLPKGFQQKVYNYFSGMTIETYKSKFYNKS